MRTEGTLQTWNDERGFGFIVTDQSKLKLFAHISAFPGTGRRPRAGERLSFLIESADDGKKRATAVIYLNPPLGAAWTATVPPPRPGGVRNARDRRDGPYRRNRRDSHGRDDRRDSGGGGFLGFGLIAALAVGGYAYLHVGRVDLASSADPPAAPSETSLPLPATPAAQYRCDGRTHCSQVRSCAEARYFLNHCPGVEMDGDGDGVPCEDQWCG